ncbi:MAG: DUF2141 domain-containing protein [Chryseolinea sp.]
MIFYEKCDMKQLLYSAIIFGLCCLQPCDVWAQTSTLEVTVNNIKSDKGTIRIGLFTKEEFLKTPFEGKIVKATPEGVTVVFENLKAGTYAISVVHDENENGKMDTNKLGIPREGYAFGNNALGKLGPPTFNQANVVIGPETVKQVLKIKYL